MRWIVLLLGVPFFFACEDEPAPEPNLPAIQGSPKAQCRKVEQTYKLDLIEVTVRDLDGVADLSPPTVFVESAELTMVATPQPGGEECEEDACDVLYTWEHGPTTEQIYCGEDGDLLIVDFAVKDQEGYLAEASIKAVPL